MRLVCVRLEGSDLSKGSVFSSFAAEKYALEEKSRGDLKGHNCWFENMVYNHHAGNIWLEHFRNISSQTFHFIFPQFFLVVSSRHAGDSSEKASSCYISI